MSRFFQRVLLAAILVLGVRQANAFALLGPLESWQTFTLGYDAGDIGGPKRIGEEYRWDVPVLTYAFDPSFINYFGTNGEIAIEQAFGIISNAFRGGVSTLNLNDFPLRGKRLNQRAAALGLLDLKTEALGAILEELGLASPERYTWTIRERSVTGTPAITNSLVTMYNFDPFNFKPTNYVNGVRYTYSILQTAFNADQFDAVEFPVDPTQPFFTTAASIVDGASLSGFGLTIGEYFNTLTRDDVGGLRYLYSTNNIQVEPSPTNAFQFGPDTTAISFFTNFDLALFSSLSLTSTPAQLQANTNFPGLLIDRTNVIGAELVTNVVVTFTNLSAFFTNFDNLSIVTNGDLFAFSSQSLTSPPAALLGAFPGLVITKTNLSVTNVVFPISVTTNIGTSPWGAPGSIGLTLITNYVTNLTTIYHYEFANILTNAKTFSPTTLIDLQTLELGLAPFGDPLAPFITNVFHTTYVTNIPSGNFAILPANTSGYVMVGSEVLNASFVTNNVIPPLIFGTAGVIFQQDQVYRYTNAQFAAYPIELTGGTTLLPVTNSVVSIVPIYSNAFLNIRTNHVTNELVVTVQTLQILNDPRAGFPRKTNTIASSLVLSNFISGDFDIIPPNGFPPVLFTFTTNILVTNIVSDIVNPITGEEDQQLVVYPFTQVISVVNPIILQPAHPTDLQPGVDRLQFVRVDFDSLVGQAFAYTNIYTNITITNNIRSTNTYQIIQGAPNFLFSASELPINQPGEIPIILNRTPAWTDDSVLNTSTGIGILAGPGVIGQVPPVVITFSKIGPSITNVQPGDNSEETARAASFSFGGQNVIWGSFDGTTNAPIVYPEDVTLQDLENLILHPQ